MFARSSCSCCATAPRWPGRQALEERDDVVGHQFAAIVELHARGAGGTSSCFRSSLNGQLSARSGTTVRSSRIRVRPLKTRLVVDVFVAARGLHRIETGWRRANANAQHGWCCPGTACGGQHQCAAEQPSPREFHRLASFPCACFGRFSAQIFFMTMPMNRTTRPVICMAGKLHFRASLASPIIRSLRMPKQSLLPANIAPFCSGRLPAAVAGAVRCGHRVFLSGFNAIRPNGEVAGLGDPLPNARRAGRDRGRAERRRRQPRRHHPSDHQPGRSHPPQVRLRSDRPAAARRASGQHRTGRRRPAVAGVDGADRRGGDDRRDGHPPSHLPIERMVRPGHRLARRHGRGRRNRTVHPRTDRLVRSTAAPWPAPDTARRMPRRRPTLP